MKSKENSDQASFATCLIWSFGATQAPLAGQTANPKGSVALPECLIFAVTRYLPSWASGSARVPLSPW